MFLLPVITGDSTRNLLPMPQYFQLDSNERKQEWLMLAFAVSGFLTVAKGVYNEYYHIDQDCILIPLLMTLFGGYFFIYGIKGLTKGNLTPKWTPFYIFQVIYFFTKTIGYTKPDKAKSFSTKLLGVCGLLISIACLIFAVKVLTQHS